MRIDAEPLTVKLAISQEMWDAEGVQGQILSKIEAAARRLGEPLMSTVDMSVSNEETIDLGPDAEGEPVLVNLWQHNLVLVTAKLLAVPHREAELVG